MPDTDLQIGTKDEMILTQIINDSEHCIQENAYTSAFLNQKLNKWHTDFNENLLYSPILFYHIWLHQKIWLFSIIP